MGNPKKSFNIDSTQPTAGNQDTPKVALLNQNAGEDENGMERVRELLVGSKMREHDAHLRGLEEKTHAQLTSLSTELRTRIDALDNYFKIELSTLTEQLRAESEERRNAVKALQVQGQSEHEFTTKAAQELNDSVQRTLRETREFVSNEARLLSDRLGDASRKLFEEIGRVETTMTASKVDKRSLSAFFGQIALQIDDSSGSGNTGAANDHGSAGRN